MSSFAMIFALHGAVGSADDWDCFQFQNEHLKALNLWDLLKKESAPLSQIGRILNNNCSSKTSYLMGYSMGGRLALHALIDNPSKWEKAIIVSAHTGMIDEDEKASRRQLDAEWSEKAVNLDWEHFLTEWNQQAILPDSSLPCRSVLKPWTKQIAGSFIDWSTGAQENLLPQLSKITTPTLWITGEHDSKFATIAEAACETMPNAHHELVSGAGHRVPWEKPAEFQKICEAFINA